MSGQTNDSTTGNGKAVDANERAKSRPEDADHVPLKDEKSKSDDK